MKWTYHALIVGFAFYTLFPVTGISQQVNWCAQPQARQMLVQDNPEKAEEIEALGEYLNQQAAAYSYNHASRAEKLIVPVVFHIIHDNGPENITDAQIEDAIRIINEDFSGENEDLDQIVPSFIDNIGTADIEFRLALKDPNGSPTNGIERIESNETYVGDDNSKLNPWPREMYLNIWVTDVISIGNAAAYAYKPDAVDGTPWRDGIISNHRYVGGIGTSSRSGSRTLTHEIGHYLNLSHTWGGSNYPGCDGTTTNTNDPCYGVNNCQEDDNVSDTPNTIGVDNGSCNTNQISCGSLDNVQNFMDYSSCELMFTEGQVNRMRSTLNNSVSDRNQLWKPGNLAATGTGSIILADFDAKQQVLCLGETLYLMDRSKYGANEWNWTVIGPKTYTSTSENPAIEITVPGLYSVSLAVKDEDGNVASKTAAGYIHVAPKFGISVPYTEDFEDLDWPSENLHVSELGGDTRNWELTSAAGFSGSKSLYLQNYQSRQKGIGLQDYLTLVIDGRPLASLNLSFKTAHKEVNIQDADNLKVEISNDCGLTWKTIFNKSGPQLGAPGIGTQSNGYTPLTTTDWIEHSISNIPSAWIGDKIFVRFIFSSGGGNNIYLDDINIGGSFKPEPMLIYPPDGADSLYKDITLDWNSVPDAFKYEYEIDTDPNFLSSGLQTGTIPYIGPSPNGEDTEFEATELSHNTTYYWRVRSYVGNTPSPWSETWSFTIGEEAVGITEERTGTALKVYPNPASDILHLAFETTSEGETEIVLRDLMGRPFELMAKQKVPQGAHSLNFNTAILPSGTYVLEINHRGEIKRQKVIIVH